jgi:hypothetical protein
MILPHSRSASHDASKGHRRCASRVDHGQLVDAALAVAPSLPTETPPDRRRKFVVISGGKAD